MAHKTSLSLPSQESERSCICVLGVSVLHLSMIFLFDLEIFWQCHIFFIPPLNERQGYIGILMQGFQSGPVPGTFTRLRSCIVPVEITEPPKISGGQNHKYDGR